MHKVFKSHNSKKAFSLVEMVLVLFIIVVLASVVGVGVAGLIKTSNKSKDAVNESKAQLKNEIADSEAMLAKYNF